jgi:hypothetical protein
MVTPQPTTHGQLLPSNFGATAVQFCKTKGMSNKLGFFDIASVIAKSH